MSINHKFAKFSFSTKKKIRILRQIQRMNKAGIQLKTSLQTLYDHYSDNGKKPKDTTAYAIREWQKKYGAGKSLAESMEGWISPSEQMIIQAGEQGNRLSESMMDALEATEASRKIKSTILKAIAYPVVLLAVICAMLYGFSIKIIPTFAEVVDPGLWTGNAARMYAMSQFVTTGLPIVLAAITAIGFLISYTLPRMTNPLRTTLDKLPPYSIYKVIAGASFMMSLRGFVSAGVPVPEALRRIAKGSTPYVKHRTMAISHKLGSGSNLGLAMKKAGHNFPDPEINGEISIYAGLDEFDKNLDILSREWINDSVEKVQAISKVFTQFMVVIMAVVVGFMALSMFELNDIITRSANMAIPQ